MITHNKEYRLSKISISSEKSLNEEILPAAATMNPGVGNLISRVVTLFSFKCLVLNNNNNKNLRHVKKQENMAYHRNKSNP